MMVTKAASIAFSFACLQGISVALDAPCYGYGIIMGSPDKYLEDDLAKVRELEVGKGDVYVANINYLFEGTNNISLTYQKVSDKDFRDQSWNHGSKDSTSVKRYNLRDQASRILNPGYVINNSKESLIGFMFVEYFGAEYAGQGGGSNVPWALAAFEPR